MKGQHPQRCCPFSIPAPRRCAYERHRLTEALYLFRLVFDSALCDRSSKARPRAPIDHRAQGVLRILWRQQHHRFFD